MVTTARPWGVNLLASSTPSSCSLLKLLTLLTVAGSPAGAELLVYEGFQYGPIEGSLAAQPDFLVEESPADVDAIGLVGTWTDALSNTEMFLKEGSLIFSDLATSGNHVGYLSNINNDVFHRPFSSEVNDAISTAGTSNRTLFFSFLFEKLQNNFGAAHEGLAIMNGILPSSRWDNGNPGAVGTHGFAVAAVVGPDLQAVAYDGTTGTQIVGGELLPITVVNGSNNTPISNQAVNLIVGEISFNTGPNGSDVFRLYQATDDGGLSADDLVLIDTIEADVDESLLSTLNVTRQVNVNYDEIRIGDSLADVFPGAPGPIPLSITSITPVGGGIFEITLTGAPNLDFEILFSPDLDFTNSTPLAGFTQNDPEDSGSIGGPDDNLLQTDEEGNATARIKLSPEPRGFLQARRY